MQVTPSRLIVATGSVAVVRASKVMCSPVRPVSTEPAPAWQRVQVASMASVALGFSASSCAKAAR